MIECLGKRTFLPSDQEKFLALSGDYNPIHVDAPAARDTFAGQCTVHGMHITLWALELFTLRHGSAATKFKVDFRKLIYLNEEVSFDWHEKKAKLLVTKDGVVAVEIKLVLGALTPNDAVHITHQNSPLQCIERSFLECSEMLSQPFNGHGDPALTGEMFPKCCLVYGHMAVYEMATISYVVGMECPGLHSLSVAYAIEFKSTVAKPFYSVLRTDERFKLVTSAIEGQTLSAEIEAIHTKC